LRSARFLLIAALCAAAVRPLAAQQEPERVVRGLNFVGNRSIDSYTLSTVIATSNSSYFASAWWVRWIGLGAKRYFDELEFRRDVVRLILFYRQSGFMRVVVDTSVRRTARDAFVTFRIYEGEPVLVTRLDVEGVTGIVDERPLRRAMPLHVGDPFDRFLFQASADTVATWLRNRGFPYVQVLRNFDSDAGALTTEVRYEAVPGPHMRVGEIVVQGVERVDTTTVLRTLSVRTGEQYSEERLYRSQRDLYGVGLFRSATVALIDTVPPPAGDSSVGVLVRVAEGPRHRIRFGGGYGTQDCFRFQSGWSAMGFLGQSRVLDLSVRITKIGVGWPFNAGLDKKYICRPLEDDVQSDTLNYNVGLTLFQSAFFSPRHTASVGAFAERRSELNTYTRVQVGSNVGVTFNARRRVPLGVSYGYAVGRTDADPAVFCSVFSVCDVATQGYLRTRRPFASVTVSASRRTEDFPLDPSSGSHIGITLLHSSRVLGSDSLYEFNRGEMEIAQYLPFGRRGVFAWRFHAGALLPVRITLAGQRTQFVPPEQRFYGGGPNSVRGYGANELGPRVYVVTDTTNPRVENGDTIYNGVRTVATGGNSILLANLEVRVAAPVFPDRLRLAAFVDVGQVYERQNELFSLRAMRVTPGVGMRFTTPLGPVRVDVAYNGYDQESGTLLLQDNTTRLLSEFRASYQRRRSGNLLRRLQLQLAIGQAF
jgi:outer membrane protein assembly complex protein YaeT